MDFHDFYPRARRHARFVVSRYLWLWKGDVEDVVQETMFRIWMAWPLQLQGRTEGERLTYVSKTAQSKSINFLRKMHGRETVSSDGLEDGGEAEVAVDESSKLGFLADRVAAALKLMVGERESDAELGEITLALENCRIGQDEWIWAAEIVKLIGRKLESSRDVYLCVLQMKFDGRLQTEIAERLGVTPAMVTRHIKTLHKLLTEDDGGDDDDDDPGAGRHPSQQSTPRKGRVKAQNSGKKGRIVRALLISLFATMRSVPQLHQSLAFILSMLDLFEDLFSDSAIYWRAMVMTTEINSQDTCSFEEFLADDGSCGCEACLARAVEEGSWEALPDLQLFETALAGFVSAHSPGDLDAAAVSRARAWVTGAAPQRHSAVVQWIEEVSRCLLPPRSSITSSSSLDIDPPSRRSTRPPGVTHDAVGRTHTLLLGEGGVVDLTAPELDSPLLANHSLPLHRLEPLTGLEVRARATEEALRAGMPVWSTCFSEEETQRSELRVKSSTEQLSKWSAFVRGPRIEADGRAWQNLEGVSALRQSCAELVTHKPFGFVLKGGEVALFASEPGRHGGNFRISTFGAFKWPEVAELAGLLSPYGTGSRDAESAKKSAFDRVLVIDFGIASRNSFHQEPIQLHRRRSAVDLTRTFRLGRKLGMNAQNKQDSHEVLTCALLRKCEVERIRHLRKGRALSVLKTRIHADAWEAFRLAVQGASSVTISRFLQLQERRVCSLLQESWLAMKSMKESADMPLVKEAVFLQQSCARVKAFQQSVHASEINKARIDGLESALHETLSRGLSA